MVGFLSCTIRSKESEYQDNTRRSTLGRRKDTGNMSPEYTWTGMFSEKSDIYSFGVRCYWKLSAERSSQDSAIYGQEGKNLIAYAWESTGGIEILDKDLDDSCQLLEVERCVCVQIGLLCVQLHLGLRLILIMT